MRGYKVKRNASPDLPDSLAEMAALTPSVESWAPAFPGQLGQSLLNRTLCEFVRVVWTDRIGAAQSIGTFVQHFEIELLHLLNVAIGLHLRDKRLGHHAISAVEIPAIRQLYEDVVTI
jgi:hypothetical protein